MTDETTTVVVNSALSERDGDTAMGYDPDELLSTSEAAEVLGVTDSYIRHLIRDKKLTAKMIGNRWIVRRGDLDEFAEPPPGGGRPRSGAPED